MYHLYGQSVATNLRFTYPVRPATRPPTLQVHYAQESAGVSITEDWARLTVETDSSGQMTSCVFRDPHTGRHVLRFGIAADFVLGADAIEIGLHDPAYAHAVEIWLLGSVFSLWSELQGRPTLHSAAVAVGDRAVGFLATNKGGKSSLAASLMQTGAPLLTDDILVLDRSGAAIVGQSSYPQMRMWPDQAAHFTGSAADLPLVVPHLTKRCVPVGIGGFGTFCDTPCPVSHLFLPERRSGAPGIQIQPLTPAEALIELVRHAFLPNTVDALGLSARRLPVLAALVQQATVARLVYPDGVEHLPAVAEAILQEVGA